MQSWAYLLHTSFIIKSTYVCIDCISSTDAFGFPWSFQNFAQLPDWGEDLRCWRLTAPLNSRRKENKFPHNFPLKCTYYSLIRCNKIGRFLLLFVKSECFCTWYTIVVCSSIESLSLNVVIMFKAKVSLTWEKNRLFLSSGYRKALCYEAVICGQQPYMATGAHKKSDTQVGWPNDESFKIICKKIKNLRSFSAR